MRFILLSACVVAMLPSMSMGAVCRVISFIAGADEVVKHKLIGENLVFSGPGVRLEAEVVCDRIPGQEVRVGWVQLVKKAYSVRSYEHGEISYIAPELPAWDGSTSPYPWYNDAEALAVNAWQPTKITLRDRPGGSAALLQRAPRRDRMSSIHSKLLRVVDNNSFVAAIVVLGTSDEPPQPIAVMEWSRSLEVNIQAQESAVPKVTVTNFVLDLSEAISTEHSVLESFRIPPPSRGSYMQTALPVWYSSDPSLWPRVVLQKVEPSVRSKLVP
jgi:hypothetical protein